MEFKSPMNFKGEGPIMILGLLKDDDDSEMMRMTDLLARLTEKSGRQGTRLNCNLSLNECKLAGATTLYITGHSRTLQEDGKIRPVPNRRLGGFEVDAVVDLLFKGITFGITDIELWCCESAWKPGNVTCTGDATSTMAQRFGFRQFEMACQHLDTGNWSQISTLDFICTRLTVQVWNTCMKTKRPLRSFPTVTITALNGVGYITKDDTYITTFDQAVMLPEYNGILDLEKQIREGREGTHTKKNLRNAEDRLRKHIAARPCHFIAYTLDFGAFADEYKALSKFLDRQKIQRQPGQQLPKAMIDHMDNTLGPLL